MRPVDLAIYADTLAAEAATLGAKLERARRRMRMAAIEAEARRALDTETIMALERLGAIRRGAPDAVAERNEITEVSRDLAALERLQSWVEDRLAAARREARSMPTREPTLAE